MFPYLDVAYRKKAALLNTKSGAPGLVTIENCRCLHVSALDRLKSQKWDNSVTTSLKTKVWTKYVNARTKLQQCGDIKLSQNGGG